MRIIGATIAVCIGMVLDLILGDPNSRWHPICLIGSLIGWLDRHLRAAACKNPRKELALGVLLVLVTVSVSTAVPAVLCYLAYRIHFAVGVALESVLCWLLLATKSLKTESMRVADALETGGLDAGRKAVSMIVGRDTESLDEAGVIRAAVETVAENASDGCLAPLFYLMIGGAPLGFFYKSINTMDSMIGYKNEVYLYFGRAAAKLDDLVNYIPARLSAWCMIAGTLWIKECKTKQAVDMWRRDRRCHASPNSAQTESVMAGALGVRLAGDAIYFGKLHKKPTIGDAHRLIERADIARANRLLYAGVFCGFGIMLAGKGLILLCMYMAGIFTTI
jgi:adenosylcobinamide-phosphate synthase